METTTETAKERRCHPRTPMILEVRRAGLSERHLARTTDVSAGGCYIESVSNVTPGEHILFQMHLPTGSWMPLSGTILYHHPNLGFGVQFMDLTAEDREKLTDMLRKSELAGGTSYS